MLIHFWGVRGSLPSPLNASGVKAKITAILEQAVPEDMASAGTKKRFIDGLPPWLFGTVGGHSPCVSVELDGYKDPIIFDSGSGIYDMGVACEAKNPKPVQYHLFFSHFHLDHLQGFPFFNPVYSQQVTIDFYSPNPNLEKILCEHLCPPCFPVTMESMQSHKNFHLLKEPVSLGPADITFKKMYHPGVSYTYQIHCNGKRFIYATDVELSTSDFLQTRRNIEFFKGADMIVLDAQYTLGEAIEKRNWGHSAFCMSVDFAAHWGIKQLVLFHHDPAYSDMKLYEISHAAQRYLQKMNINGLDVKLAIDGLEIEL